LIQTLEQKQAFGSGVLQSLANAEGKEFEQKIAKERKELAPIVFWYGSDTNKVLGFAARL